MIMSPQWLQKGSASIKIGNTSEYIGAWTWNGMEQEDIGNIGVGKMSECEKMSEECGKHRKCWSVEQENIRKHQKHRSMEQEDVGIWKTLEMSECEIGMEIWGRENRIWALRLSRFLTLQSP